MKRLVFALIATFIIAASLGAARPAQIYIPKIVAVPASTSIPTATATATAIGVPAHTSIPTSTATPTATDTATFEPTVTATETPTETPVFEAPSTATSTTTPTPTPTATQPASGPCSCNGDTLNCSDFSTHSQAQACFNWCVSQGAGDIHKLDQDNDGDACESLPGGFTIVR